MSFLELRKITKFFGGLAAVKDVNFGVEKGEIFGLIGPNGSGKTTVFNLINGYYPLSSGTIFFKGKKIDGLKTHKICKLGIGRTFQVVKPLSRMTVLDNVMASAFCRVNTVGEARKAALEIIDYCGLTPLKGQLAKSLPIASRKRLEIARALSCRPELLLLDETASGLNPSELEEAIELIKRIRGSGITIIVVEHIMKVIMSISDRIHVINFGQTIAQGTPKEVANNQAVIEAYLGESYAAS